jgi:hypothetical protein
MFRYAAGHQGFNMIQPRLSPVKFYTPREVILPPATTLRRKEWSK